MKKVLSGRCALTFWDGGGTKIPRARACTSPLAQAESEGPFAFLTLASHPARAYAAYARRSVRSTTRARARAGICKLPITSCLPAPTPEPLWRARCTAYAQTRLCARKNLLAGLRPDARVCVTAHRRPNTRTRRSRERIRALAVRGSPRSRRPNLAREHAPIIRARAHGTVTVGLRDQPT